MDLINAMTSNTSVNTNRGNNRMETVFSMRSAPSKSMGIYRKYVTRRRSGKPVSTTMGDSVFRGVRIKESS